MGAQPPLAGRTGAGPPQWGAVVSIVFSDLEKLTAEVVKEVFDSVPFYRDSGMVSRADFDAAVRLNLAQARDRLLHPHDQIDASAAWLNGTRRAERGVPVAEGLRAYRVAFHFVWKQCLSVIGSSQAEQEMASALGSALWRLSDDFSVAFNEGHQHRSAELALQDHERRASLFDMLLSGAAEVASSPWEVAEQLGLHRDRAMVTIVARVPAPGSAGVVGAELRLRRRGVGSAWRLSTAEHVGVVSVVAGDVADLADLLEPCVVEAAGVSPPVRDPLEIPRAIRLARVAASWPAERRIRLFPADPIAELLSLTPPEARRMVDGVFKRVNAQPSAERDILVRTLQVWFDCDGAIEAAAQQLYCHPNTVRNRLNRIAALTSVDLATPRGMALLTLVATGIRVLAASSD